MLNNCNITIYCNNTIYLNFIFNIIYCTRPVQQFFFHVVFRFYDELPASRAPSSSLAGSRAPLQFPDCITCYPPVSRLHHVLSSCSLAVSHAPLQFPDCITCYPRVHKMYHAPAPPPPPLWPHLERNIIFIFTVCYFY